MSQPPPTSSVPVAAEPPWEQALRRTADGHVIACSANAYLAIKLAPELRGYVRFNQVTKDIEVQGGPFAGVSAATLSIEVANWLQLRCLMYKATKGWVEDQLLVAAYQNAFDPIADYLNGLVWDG